MPSIPDGMRVYAVGDVHGRLDLLEVLIEALREDNELRGPADTRIIFLGDLVDRGPASAQVIDFLLSGAIDFASVDYIAGNHEDAFLDVLAGRNETASTSWFRFGGVETLKSYGVSSSAIALRGLALFDELHHKVPRRHIEFLETFEPHLRLGNYLFVHAGIKPGVALERQAPHDLMWIRDEFLEDGRDHGMIVVHGHSVTDAVDRRTNRIGIDTGAYKSGRLTALGLQGTDRWTVSTRPMLSRHTGRLAPAIGVETADLDMAALANDVA